MENINLPQINNPKKILFPISIDSQMFSTLQAVEALNSIPGEFSEVIFFIADGLHLYNKATMLKEGVSLKSIFDNFELKSDYSKERNSWLQSIHCKIKSPISDSIWTIRDVFYFSDSSFYRIYRNVLIAYFALKNFREDIEATAKFHRAKFSKDYSHYDFELSIGYILEEIALNIRVHLIEQVEFEYYIGTLPLPLLKLYEGKYDIDVYTLAGVRQNCNYSFYHSPDDSFTNWIEAKSN